MDVREVDDGKGQAVGKIESHGGRFYGRIALGEARDRGISPCAFANDAFATKRSKPAIAFYIQRADRNLAT